MKKTSREGGGEGGREGGREGEWREVQSVPRGVGAGDTATSAALAKLN